MKQYKTIDGNWANETNCVAFCCRRKYNGYMTIKQLRLHRCLRRQCRRLRKLEDRQYWKERQRRKAEKKERKDGKLFKKSAQPDA